ncbi:MAG: hypothetical protein AAGB02_03605 [Pseudomonadota bacterium]
MAFVRIVIFILVLLLVVVIALISIAMTAQGGMPTGGDHPVISNMSVGGSGYDRTGPILTQVFVWQCSVIIFAILMISLGVPKKRRTIKVYLSLSACALVSIAVWSALFLAYRAYLESGSTMYFLGFPVASAWMVYGIWIGHLPLTVIYVFGFHKRIFTEKDQAEFAAILSDHQKRRAE